MDNPQLSTPEQLATELTRLIKEVDTAYLTTQDCAFDEGDDFNPCKACIENINHAANSLFSFWNEHRDRVKFAVWTSDESLSENIIFASPVEEKQ